VLLQPEAPAAGLGALAAPAHAAAAGDPSSFVFGSSADLDSHRIDGTCWQHFDFGMLQTWDDTAAAFCLPAGVSPHSLEAASSSAGVVAAAAVAASQGSAPGHAAPTRGRRMLAHLAQRAPPDASWLVCRVTVDNHLPGPTAPHTMCDGANVVWDWGRMTEARCPLNRPGYKCDGGPVFYHYAPGALQVRREALCLIRLRGHCGRCCCIQGTGGQWHLMLRAAQASSLSFC
jgi:hypothetical protein